MYDSILDYLTGVLERITSSRLVLDTFILRKGDTMQTNLYRFGRNSSRDGMNERCERV
jgi:hypothetical protein